MKLSSIKRLFGGKPPPESRLVGITSERTGERTLLGVESLLSSIAVPEPFSLEIAGDAAGVTLLVRCREGSFVKQQLGVHYLQARVGEVSPEDDPLRLAEGEQARSMNLRLKGPEYLPLRTFKDDDLRDQGSDPLISVIGSMSDLRDGERLVARLKLLSLGPEWARHHQEKAERRQRPDPAYSPQNTQAQIDTKNGVTLAILGVVALVGLRGYLWIRDGETWKAVRQGLGVAVAEGVEHGEVTAVHGALECDPGGRVSRGQEASGEVEQLMPGAVPAGLGQRLVNEFLLPGVFKAVDVGLDDGVIHAQLRRSLGHDGADAVELGGVQQVAVAVVDHGQVRRRAGPTCSRPVRP